VKLKSNFSPTNFDTMKKIIAQALLLIALLISFTNVYSQEKPPQDRANKWTEWMKKNLQLKDDQVAKVQPINLKYATQLNDIKKDTAGGKVNWDKVKENDAKMDAELKAVFTQQQFKTYDTKKTEMKEDRKDKQDGGNTTADKKEGDKKKGNKKNADSTANN